MIGWHFFQALYINALYACRNEVYLTFRLEQAVEEESGGERNLQAEGPNYNLSGKLTEYSNTYKVHCMPLFLVVNFTCCYGAMYMMSW